MKRAYGDQPNKCRVSEFEVATDLYFV